MLLCTLYTFTPTCMSTSFNTLYKTTYPSSNLIYSSANIIIALFPYRCTQWRSNIGDCGLHGQMLFYYKVFQFHTPYCTMHGFLLLFSINIINNIATLSTSTLSMTLSFLFYIILLCHPIASQLSFFPAIYSDITHNISSCTPSLHFTINSNKTNFMTVTINQVTLILLSLLSITSVTLSNASPLINTYRHIML